MPRPASRSGTRLSSIRQPAIRSPLAPLIVKDKVIVGPSGGEYGIRGFVAAFDAATGNEVWRFNTIPGPGEPGHETWEDPAKTAWKTGGGPAWVTGSYDPELNLTYWGTGQSRSGLERRSAARRQPLYGFGHRARRRHRQAEVALPVHTSRRVRLRRHAGARAGGHHLAGQPAQGDVVGEPERLRGTCSIEPAVSSCQGKPFTKVNWMDGFDEKGRPNRVLNSTAEGTLVYPNNQGATNWYSPVVQPAHRAFLHSQRGWTPSRRTSKRRSNTKRATSTSDGFRRWRSRRCRTGPGSINQRLPEDGYGAILAFDPKTGERKWEFKMIGRHRQRRADDGVGSGVRRRTRRLFLRARRPHGRRAVEGQRRRPGLGRTDVILGRRQAVRGDRGRQHVVRVRFAAV